MLVGGRDKRINHLETEIKKRKEFLLLKQKELEQNVNNNKYLEGVTKNYKNYYDTVVKEKQQQYDAMMLLKEYLDDTIVKDKMTDNQIRDAKRQQREIVFEMEKITHELKKII
uniref:Uncharacterized protein n=1 Tax=viral metagenome TaxID=1070528 RepID=A0A6C0I6G9_9ZZZZ